MEVPTLEEFNTLLDRVIALESHLAKLEANSPEYMREEEAQRLTGLGRQTLNRLRKAGKLEWKQDHGVRYLRSSLLAYNQSRAVVRGSAPKLSGK